VSLSLTSIRNKKIEHYIKIKTHKPIVLRFWIESGVSALYGLVQVSYNLTSGIKTDSINQLVSIY